MPSGNFGWRWALRPNLQGTARCCTALRGKGHFASDRRIDRDRSELVDRVVKMAGENVRPIV